MLSAFRFIKTLPVYTTRGRLLVHRSFSAESLPMYADLYPAEGAQPKKPKKGYAIDWISLKRYLKLHGHLLVPQKFKFEEDEDHVGPRGVALGLHVAYLRKRYSLSVTKTEPWISELEKLEFVWNAREAQFRTLMHAILTYKDEYGDFLIPVTYVVKNYSDIFYPEYWGLPIGNLYRNLLCNKLSDERRQIMKEMGVPCDKVLSRRAEKLLQAIEVYKQLNNQTSKTLNISFNYAVPIYDEKWPEALWGYKLGQVLRGVCVLGHFASYRDQFIAAGVRLNSDEELQKSLDKYASYREARRAKKALNPDPEGPTKPKKTHTRDLFV